MLANSGSLQPLQDILPFLLSVLAECCDVTASHSSHAFLRSSYPSHLLLLLLLQRADRWQIPSLFPPSHSVSCHLNESPERRASCALSILGEINSALDSLIVCICVCTCAQFWLLNWIKNGLHVFKLLLTCIYIHLRPHSKQFYTSTGLELPLMLIIFLCQHWHCDISSY